MTTNFLQDMDDQAIAREAEIAGLSDDDRLADSTPVWAVRQAAERAHAHRADREQADKVAAEHFAQRQAEWKAAQAETCTETDGAGKVACGQPVTDKVEWDMHPDGHRRPEAPVTVLVCGKHADALMGWAATHLSPRRTDLTSNEEWADELAAEAEAEYGSEDTLREWADYDNAEIDAQWSAYRAEYQQDIDEERAAA